MTNKERYSEWVAAQEYVPIFMQPWWMDAVCAGKEWDVLLVESPTPTLPRREGDPDERHEIIGAMPYLLRKRAWFRYIIMPQQTQIGGIWVNEEATADKWKTAEVCRQIKEQMDRMGLAYYYQQYLPGSLCVDAMRALGFKTRERVTYRMEDLSNLDAVIDRFSKNKKRQLQKARNRKPNAFRLRPRNQGSSRPQDNHKHGREAARIEKVNCSACIIVLLVKCCYFCF